MLNKKRKGFTIVELVIVIAVIAVLAAVLIPTFSSVVDRAHESAALQEVQNAYIEALAEALGSDLKDKEVEVGDFTFKFDDATGQNAKITNSGEFGTKYPNAAVVNGVVVLGPASDETDETNGGSGNPVTTAEELIAALKAGGDVTVTLGDSIVITEPISIPSGATATIDLAGYTLQVNDSNPTDEEFEAEVSTVTVADFYPAISVSGILKITDSNNNEPGKFVLNEANGTYSDYYSQGICVNAGGTLNLTDVDIEGNRDTNIENEGTVNLTTGTEFTVNGGTGLSNEGIAAIQGATFTVNSGTGFANSYAGTVDNVKISDNTSFVLNGYNVIAIENDGGKMSVTETNISKSTGFTCDEYYSGTIYVYDNAYSNNSEISLENVTVAEGMGKSVHVGLFCKATIDGGTYYGVSCNGGLIIEAGTFKDAVSVGGTDSSITINDGYFTDTGAVYCNNAGTINIDGGTFDGGVSSAHNEATIKITNGTFNSALTLSECSHIYISGGTFNGAITLNNTGTKNISGGTFASDISAYDDYFAAGYTATKDETTGYWTITKP